MVSPAALSRQRRAQPSARVHMLRHSMIAVTCQSLCLDSDRDHGQRPGVCAVGRFGQDDQPRWAARSLCGVPPSPRWGRDTAPPHRGLAAPWPARGAGPAQRTTTAGRTAWARRASLLRPKVNTSRVGSCCSSAFGRLRREPQYLPGGRARAEPSEPRRVWLGSRVQVSLVQVRRR